jgi:4-hydroxybutyrate dehydrogenase/sulfolactaldehyde 3-reductase
LGATPVASLADLTEASDVVFAMLPGPPEVNAALLSPEGIVAHGRPGMALVNMSTVDPATIDALAASGETAGMAVVDAAVGRLREDAERGESLFMVGADEDALARVRPMLDAMGNRIHVAGPVGAGTRTKLVIHFLAIVSCQMNAEAFALAQGLGLDLPPLYALMQGTTAVNGQMLRRYPRKVFAGDVEPGCSTDLVQADLGLAIAAAGQAGVPVPLAETASAAIDLACAAGYRDRDFSSLLDHWCERAGVAKCRFPAQVL